MNASCPEKLFFYTDASHAIQILESGTLNWYSPTIFDGVTELSPDSQLLFDKTRALTSSIKYACSLIFGPDEPRGETAIIAAVRRWRQSQRFATPEEAERVLSELASKMIDQQFLELDKMILNWRASCQKLRILSLFEKSDNFSVWDKYGANFRGVCFALDFSGENPLCAPKPIKYQNIHPEITTLKEQIASLFYGKKPEPYKNISNKFLSKAPAYSKEKEWRGFRTEEPAENAQQPYDFNPEKLQAIYFGPAISPSDKDQLLTVIKNVNSTLTCHQLDFHKGTFDLVSSALT